MRMRLFIMEQTLFVVFRGFQKTYPAACPSKTYRPSFVDSLWLVVRLHTREIQKLNFQKSEFHGEPNDTKITEVY